MSETIAEKYEKGEGMIMEETIAEKYELSDDGLGLIAHCKPIEGKDFTCHIHSDELSILEKWIKKLLEKESN